MPGIYCRSKSEYILCMYVCISSPKEYNDDTTPAFIQRYWLSRFTIHYLCTRLIVIIRDTKRLQNQEENQLQFNQQTGADNIFNIDCLKKSSLLLCTILFQGRHKILYTYWDLLETWERQSLNPKCKSFQTMYGSWAQKIWEMPKKILGKPIKNYPKKANLLDTNFHY